MRPRRGVYSPATRRGRTDITCHFLFETHELEKPSFDASDTVDFWDLVNRQDWAVCEGVQNGIRSRVHTHGYYAPMEDWNLDIRRYVTERIAAFVTVVARLIQSLPAALRYNQKKGWEMATKRRVPKFHRADSGRAPRSIGGTRLCAASSNSAMKVFRSAASAPPPECRSA